MIDLKPFKAMLCEIGCDFAENRLLAEYTTFKIGGACPVIASPADCGQVKKIIEFCFLNNIPYYIFGKGSDLLVNGAGLSAPVLLIRENLSGITLDGEDVVTCLAGTSVASLCKFACDNSLSGLEFAFGIPGTVGGAVYMNAGAYGGEIKDVFLSCEAVDKSGKTVVVDNNAADFGYRSSAFTDGGLCVTSVSFKLNKGNKADIKAKMEELLKRRKDKQPLEYPSAGSTFKRPAGNYASALIDRCGLRGFSIGGAQVSEKHCGFVINKNNASFDDVLRLIEYIKKTVYEKTGYTLECEVKIL